MAISGISSAYSNVYESMYASSKKEVTEKQEGTAGKKYTNAEEYYDYLKSKYECLNAKNYKVTISPEYLEKCVKDPEKAELLEKNLAHLPVSHQNMTAFWSAKGASVVNEQWIFDENGNCGGSPNMYVTNQSSSSGSSVQVKKKTERKTTPQDYYEKRKQLREQFEKKQAEKKQIREQFKERQEKKALANRLAQEQYYEELLMRKTENSQLQQQMIKHKYYQSGIAKETVSAAYEANVLLEPVESGGYDSAIEGTIV